MLWNAYSSRGLELLVGVSFGGAHQLHSTPPMGATHSVAHHHVLLYEELCVLDSRQSIEAGRIKE